MSLRSMLSKAGQAERPPSARLARPWLDPLAKPSLRVAGVSKRFGALRAVDDVSLDIHRGELFALLGGSGCGKTTLLRIMAGFVIPEAGSLTLDGQDLLALPPYDRPVSMMFQSYALFPHMSVFDNVAFGLRRDRVPRNEIAVRVKQALDLVQMDGLAHRKPAQLSGGQRQRVALARSIVKRPKVLLLDEPLSALDRKLREATQFELVNIQEEVGITFVMVTHDQEEAMTMATRIAVMDHGRVVQVGTPGEVYDLPRSRFVADFIGAVNLFDGTLRDADGTASRIDCPALGAPILVAGAVRTGEAGSACIAVRPERMRLGPADLPLGLANEVTGQVRDMAYLGDCRVYQVAVASGKLVKVTEPATRGAAVDAFGRDQTVRVGWPADAGISVEP